jgi:inner membrane protein
MQFKLMLKVLFLAGLTAFFAIPFVMIGLIGEERRATRDRVVTEIAQSTAGAQRLAGPILVFPYRQRILTTTSDGSNPPRTVSRVVSGQLIVLPESLVVTSAIELEERYRGIYKAHLYRGDFRLTGEFRLPEKLEVAGADLVEWDAPFLAVGVSDSRGMRRAPTLEWDGAARLTQPGTNLSWVASGFSAPLEPLVPGGAGRTIRFAVDVPLVGTEKLHVVPMGKDTRVKLASSWPHPSFTGRFLPDTRSVSAQGFQAEWQLSRFATDIETVVGNARHQADQALDACELGVGFLEPVDVYRLSDRALRYGMLFVLLTFVAFFLFEVLRALSVHPVQYGLVGAALAIFFLLLVSLSEHLPFAVAYGVASAACVGLLVVYVAHPLRSGRRGLGFGVALAAMYVLLFVVLRSEDYALLLGALLLFAILALVMLATRRVDWYRVGEGRAGESISTAPPSGAR